MPLWKLNFVPFGLVRIPFWVLAEDQALEPLTVDPATVRKAAPAEVIVERASPPEPTAERSPPASEREPNGLTRFVDRLLAALVRFGEASYQAKVRSGRLNHYNY